MIKSEPSDKWETSTDKPTAAASAHTQMKCITEGHWTEAAGQERTWCHPLCCQHQAQQGLQFIWDQTPTHCLDYSLFLTRYKKQCLTLQCGVVDQSLSREKCLWNTRCWPHFYQLTARSSTKTLASLSVDFKPKFKNTTQEQVQDDCPAIPEIHTRSEPNQDPMIPWWPSAQKFNAVTFQKGLPF